jgi:uncharacterized protein DUF3237
MLLQFMKYTHLNDWKGLPFQRGVVQYISLRRVNLYTSFRTSSARKLARQPRVCIAGSILNMNIAGIHFGSLTASRENTAENFPTLGVRDQVQSWRRLPSSTLELMTITVFPKPTLSTWRQVMDTDRGLWIPGGVFSGPVLNGTLDHTSVKGRYDAAGRCIHILARAKMITKDGVVIYKTDRSRWLGRDDAIDRLVNGQEVVDREYYLVGIIEYSVSDPSYAWLEKGQYLSRGLVDGDLLHIAQFRAIPSP